MRPKTPTKNLAELPLYNTLFVGKVAHRFGELGSTNAHALELLAKTEPVEGTVISTRFQTAGRGQIGSSWQSVPDANLALSVILYPRFLPAVRAFVLNQVAALAVADTVASCTGAQARLKWPNDVLLQDRKVCGILIQNGIHGKRLQWSVTGIGLNVNQQDFGPGLPRAGSLCTVLGQTFDREEMEATLLQALERRYLQARSGAEAGLQQDYLARLYRRGETRDFVRDDGTGLRGQIEGVEADGRLRIRRSDGEAELFSFKRVRFADYDTL